MRSLLTWFCASGHSVYVILDHQTRQQPRSVVHWCWWWLRTYSLYVTTVKTPGANFTLTNCRYMDIFRSIDGSLWWVTWMALLMMMWKLSPLKNKKRDFNTVKCEKYFKTFTVPLSSVVYQVIAKKNVTWYDKKKDFSYITAPNTSLALTFNTIDAWNVPFSYNWK